MLDHALDALNYVIKHGKVRDQQDIDDLKIIAARVRGIVTINSLIEDLLAEIRLNYPGLDAVLVELQRHDPPMRLAFLMSPNVAMEGKRPFDLLKQGNAFDVLRAARTLEEHGAI